MTDYQAHSVAVSALGAAQREQMAALYLHHYAGSDERRFFADLDAKSEVVLLHAAGHLVGFTTLVTYDYRWQGRDLLIVYSGDTIVAPAHWGQQVLAFRWIARMGELQRCHPERRLFWFLIVKGHRTYRYLPAFSRSFYPSWRERRDDLKRLADALAKERFGDAYDAGLGLIQFPSSRGHLRPELARPTGAELDKPAVRFFLDRNPGYVRGDELVCLCELSEENLKPLSRRLFRKDANA